MHRNYLVLTLIVVGCLFHVNVLANTDFNFYPNDEVPGWLTELPYQRNIYLDFATDPSSNQPGPIPGADYEGLADPDVWDSDQLTLTGDVVVESGKIGLKDGGSGSIAINLANLETKNPIKRIYLEGIVSTNNPFALLPEDRVAADYDLPDGYEEIDSDFDFEIIDLLSGKFLIYGWAEINPNPPWEAAVLSFSKIPVGTNAWIESVHIATECVPRSDCIADTDSDGVVDGVDLAGYIAQDLYFSVEKLAQQFGSTDC